MCVVFACFFFFQAENGIRYLVRSRGLGDVYKRQLLHCPVHLFAHPGYARRQAGRGALRSAQPGQPLPCILYTSDAADDLLCVDLGGRRILKKKRTKTR